MKKQFVICLLLAFSFSVTAFADVGRKPKAEKFAVFELKSQISDSVFALPPSNSFAFQAIVREIKEMGMFLVLSKQETKTEKIFLTDSISWRVSVIQYSTLSDKHENSKYRNYLRYYCYC